MGAAESRDSTLSIRDKTAARAGVRRFVLVALAAAAVLSARPAHAVSCANPDYLCRGNPCVTGRIEVQSPCVVDFGDRTLVIGGTLKVPNGGVLSLKAGAIDVRRAIVGRHASPFSGAGAKITLTATRDIAVHWRVDASARTVPGSIQLSAGGNIDLLAPVRAATNGPEPVAGGGLVAIDAGGRLVAIKRARIRAHGATNTPGGQVLLNGMRGVSLQNRVTVRGSAGGNIGVSSGAGSVFVAERLDAVGSSGDGGAATIIALGGTVTLYDQVNAEGLAHGGSIALLSNGPITTNAALRAGSTILAGAGGSVLVASNGGVLVGDVVYADGASGGLITVSSQSGTARISAPLVATGNRTVGGSVLLSGGVSAVVESSVDTDGAAQGGSIGVSGKLVALNFHGGLFARGKTGGRIDLNGAAVTIPFGARVQVDGDVPGGTITLAATDGDLLLGGDFRARGRTGGRIEGTASGDVIADGEFAARGNGCISLSAGSRLDISGGAFDVPVVDHCP
jgi:hypothetical protein